MISKQSDIFIYTHTLHSIEALVWLKNKKIGTLVNAACQGIIFACHSFASPVLRDFRCTISKILAFDANVDIATLVKRFI